MAADLVVRVASNADSVAIQAIDNLSFEPHEQFDQDFYDLLWEGTRFRTYVSATSTGLIVAYALLDHATNPIRLRSMAVHPNHRRRGLGEVLLQYVVASTPGNIDLWVNADNGGARRLYERIGFSVDPNQRGASDQDVMQLLR